VKVTTTCTFTWRDGHASRRHRSHQPGQTGGQGLPAHGRDGEGATGKAKGKKMTSRSREITVRRSDQTSGRRQKERQEGSKARDLEGCKAKTGASRGVWLTRVCPMGRDGKTVAPRFGKVRNGRRIPPQAGGTCESDGSKGKQMVRRHE